MKPPADLPWELVLYGDVLARQLDLEPGDFWAILYRKQEKPPGWDEAIREAFAPLTSAPIRTKDRYMAQALSRDRKTVVGRPMETDHPFALWLRSKKLTLTEWAFEHGFKRERVKSWIAEGAGGRPIPRDAAEMIAKDATPTGGKRSAVPATAATWKNGIRE